MFTEYDYLFHAERHKDDIARAERYRREQAVLPKKVMNHSVVRWLLQLWKTSLVSWSDELRSPGPAAQNRGARSA